MKLPDVNILLYAFDTSSRYHKKAGKWLEHVLSGTETVAFSWAALLGFIRISTNRRVHTQPFDVATAFGIVDRWLSQPCATIVHPTPRHASLLRELLEPLGTGGNLTTDAHLAALSIEHGAELCSADVDFSRFAGVRWVNPLAGDKA